MFLVIFGCSTLLNTYNVLFINFVNKIIMETNSFKMCIDCVNKQSNPNLPQGMYYCPYVLLSLCTRYSS